MSDPKSKNDDKAAILPLGQPALSAEFTDFRNMVLTSLSTEECERVLVEMSHDMSSFTFDQDEQAVDFTDSLVPPVSPDALPSSQILAEGGFAAAADTDFAGFEALDLDENTILAQIEERIVDLESSPVQLEDDELETDLGIPDEGAAAETDSDDGDGDLSGFSDLNLGEFNLDGDASGLEDLDFQSDLTVSGGEEEVLEPAEIEAPQVLDSASPQEADDISDLDLDDVDTDLAALDFGDDAFSAEPEVLDGTVALSQAETFDAQAVSPEPEVPDIKFEAPGEPSALGVLPEEDAVDAFDPAAFDPLPEEDISTEAFTPDLGEADPVEPELSEADTPIDGAMFDEPEDAGDDEQEALDLDLGSLDFDHQDLQDDTFAVSDDFAPAEDDFVAPVDDEPVDMVAVISSERDEGVDEAPPVYDALEGERVRPVAQSTSPQTFIEAPDEGPAEDLSSSAEGDEDRSAPPNFAEFAENPKKRGWVLPVAASVAALALAAGGGYYYYSIGTPGLEQYLGGQRSITIESAETMPGDDFSQGVLPQNFVPVTADPAQGGLATDMPLGAPPASIQATIESAPEIAALFADLDVAVSAAPVSPVAAEVESAASPEPTPSGEGLDLGLEGTGLPDAVEPGEASEDPPVTPAPASDLISDADFARLAEVQEMFAQQLITLQAEIEDMKTGSLAAPGQANVMGEIMLEVTRLAEQMAVVNARLMGVEGRVASVPTVTLPGASNGNDEALRRLEQQMELLSNNVGIIARMAAGSSNSAVPGFNAVSDAPVAPLPAPRPPSEAPRVSDSPAQAAGFTISSKPTNATALGRVAKGDFVEGYGYVLDVMPISGGGKLVQMENGTVLVE